MSTIDEERKYHDFEVIQEVWNKYRLEDGVLLKLKLVLKKLFEIKKDDKIAQVSLDYQQITALGEVPSNLRGDRNMDPVAVLRDENITEKFIDFKTEIEDWNEYVLNTDKRRLRVKYSLRAVHKTNLFDTHGEPVYSVLADILVMGLPPR